MPGKPRTAVKPGNTRLFQWFELKRYKLYQSFPISMKLISPGLTSVLPLWRIVLGGQASSSTGSRKRPENDQGRRQRFDERAPPVCHLSVDLSLICTNHLIVSLSKYTNTRFAWLLWSAGHLLETRIRTWQMHQQAHLKNMTHILTDWLL